MLLQGLRAFAYIVLSSFRLGSQTAAAEDELAMSNGAVKVPGTRHESNGGSAAGGSQAETESTTQAGASGQPMCLHTSNLYKRGLASLRKMNKFLQSLLLNSVRNGIHLVKLSGMGLLRRERLTGANPKWPVRYPRSNQLMKGWSAKRREFANIAVFRSWADSP
jgi:hypothetical protein